MMKSLYQLGEIKNVDIIGGVLISGVLILVEISHMTVLTCLYLDVYVCVCMYMNV